MLVSEEPPGPLGVPAGKVRVASDRSTPEREPYRDLDSFKGIVESQFVFDTIIGESLVPFRVGKSKRTVIPYEEGHFLATGTLEIDAHDGLAEWWRDVWLRTTA